MESSTIDNKILQEYFTNSSIIKSFDLENNKISYRDIVQFHVKEKLNPEERVRAYLMTKLVDELGYKPEYIEIEKTYDIGRPKVNKPRIDIILRESCGGGGILVYRIKNTRRI